MPVIPQFDGAIATPTPASQPRADPNAFAAPDAALAQGAAAVSSGLQEWGARYAEAKRQSDTANGIADVTAQSQESQFKWGKVPDQEAAVAGYSADMDAAINTKLAGVSDPLVKNALMSRLGLVRVLGMSAVRQAAFGQQASQEQGLSDQRQSVYSGALANAKNPEEEANTFDNIRADATSTAAAHWIMPARVPVVISSTIRSAVMQRAMNDPINAQRLMTEYGKYLMPDDQGYLARVLAPEVRRAQGAAIGAAVIGGGTPQAPDGSPDAAGLANNVSNLRATDVPWDGKGAPSNGFETFATPEAGVRAAVKNIQFQAVKAGGSITLNDLIGSWAPASDHNDPVAYAAQVAAATGLKATAPLDFHDPAVMAKVVKAMTGVEKGGVAFGDDVFQRGAESAVNDTSLSDVAGGGGTAAAPAHPAYGLPDVQAQLDEVNRRTAALPLDVQQHAQNVVLANFHKQSALQAGARSDLGRQVSDLEAAYEHGLTTAPIPEDKIWTLYPPDQASRAITELRVTRQAGDLFNGVKFASPADEQQAKALLAPGATPGDTDQMRLRTEIAARYGQMVAQKHQAVADDPAGYAAQEPGVQARLGQVDPNKPETLGPALDASMAMQRKLGVADQDTRVLTSGRVKELVNQLNTTDPANGDMGGAIDGLAKQYGDYWPKAFGELVRVGKLSPDWQTVATMDSPAQAGARTDLVRALQASAVDGGAAKLKEAAPQDAVRDIGTGLDKALEPFRQTAAISGLSSNTGVLTTVKDSVSKLAYFYAAQGKSGADALQAAVDGVLNSKYDFDGTMRYPKGMAGPVNAATAAARAALTPDQLAPVAGNPDLTPEQRQSIVATAAQKSGKWVPNENDDGLMLVAPLRDGSNVPVRLKNGGRIEVKFKDIAQPGAAGTSPAQPAAGAPPKPTGAPIMPEFP